MKRTIPFILAAILVIALSLTWVYAQNHGANAPAKGCCAVGAPTQGAACPMGKGGPGMGRGAGTGGWWTRVQPTTMAQTDFLYKVTQLHNAIRDKQFALRDLYVTKADPKQIDAAKADLQKVRTELYDYMVKNQAIAKELMPAGAGCSVVGKAGCSGCPGPANCPMGGTCAGCPGPENCAMAKDCAGCACCADGKCTCAETGCAKCPCCADGKCACCADGKCGCADGKCGTGAGMGCKMAPGQGMGCKMGGPAGPAKGACCPKK